MSGGAEGQPISTSCCSSALILLTCADTDEGQDLIAAPALALWSFS